MAKIILRIFFILNLFIFIRVAAFAEALKIPHLSKKWEYQLSTSGSIENKNWIVANQPLRLPRSYQGYILYKTIFNVEKNFLKNPREIGLSFGSIGDADEVYVNDFKIAKTGDFPPFYQYFGDSYREYLINHHVLLRGKNTLFVKVYTKYFVNKGLNLDNVKIGLHHELQNQKYLADLKNFSFRISLPLLCIGLALASLPWMSLKKCISDKILFFLSLNYFFFGLSRARITFHIFSLVTAYKIHVLLAYSGITLICLYAQKIAKVKKPLPIFTIFFTNFLFAIYSVFLNDLSSIGDVFIIWFFVETVFISYSTWIIFKASKSLSSWFKVGYLMLFICVLNDVLVDLRILNFPRIIDVGFTLFLITIFFGQIVSIRNRWQENQKIEMEHESQKKIFATAAQLAHDIRSPLAALQVATNMIDEMPDEAKELMNKAAKRIQDISNDLLKKNRDDKSDAAKNEFLPSLVEEIILEKNLQYQSRPGIKIIFDYDKKIKTIFMQTS